MKNNDLLNSKFQAEICQRKFIRWYAPLIKISACRQKGAKFEKTNSTLLIGNKVPWYFELKFHLQWKLRSPNRFSDAFNCEKILNLGVKTYLQLAQNALVNFETEKKLKTGNLRPVFGHFGAISLPTFKLSRNVTLSCPVPSYFIKIKNLHFEAVFLASV